MQRPFKKATAKKENDFLCQILSEILVEKEASRLFNKTLLIQLLRLKICQPTQFKEIRGGHSNDTYHCIDENLVLRFPKAYNPFPAELLVEAQNLIQAQLLNLTPLKAVAYYSKYGVLVTEFIPSYQPLSATDLKSPVKLIALAHLVKKLHYSAFNFKKNPETAISFTDKSSKSFQTIKTILNEKDYHTLKKLTGIKNFLAKSSDLKCPSHGDLHHFNVIDMNGKLQLIDWEFSSLEDPAYDISRLFCVTAFNNEQKTIFLNTYKNSCSIILSELDIKNLIKRIRLYESLHYFSIVIWARYAIPFFYEDKQTLLQETIENYTQKNKLIKQEA